MTPNPILKVLSTLKKHGVKSLLIGGQACIVYGGAEFSRDSDFIILSTPDNLQRLSRALKALKAELIYVPPLERRYLERGHACHFRCGAKDVTGLRIDVLSRLRGCEPFETLWRRRNTVTPKGGGAIDVINLRDLVQSKKTQRDKDWLMLKRLVDNDIFLNKTDPLPDRLRWWFSECRDASLLVELAQKYPKIAKELISQRPLLSSAVDSDIKNVHIKLQEEELLERQKDAEYWFPLRKELEKLRRELK